MSNAIQPDVSEESEEKKEAVETPHDKQMRELQERRAAEQKVPDTDESEGETETIETEGDGEPTEDEAKPVIKTIKFKDDDGNIYEVPESAYTTLNIDGQELGRSVLEVTRGYQKGATGDKRLEEANKALKALQQREKALVEQREKFEATQKKTEKDLSDKDDQKALEELTEALVEADSETIKRLLPRFLKRTEEIKQETKAFNPDEIDSMLDSKITEMHRKASIMSARKKFNTEYKELASDPNLFDLVDKESKRLLIEEPGLEPWDNLSQAAESVKKWLGSFSPRDTKKKKQTTPTPVSGRASLGEEIKPKTRRETLNEMRAARGQPLL